MIGPRNINNTHHSREKIRRWLICLALCSCLCSYGVQAEVRHLDYVLAPGADTVSYDRGHLIAPAAIDASNVVLTIGNEDELEELNMVEQAWREKRHPFSFVDIVFFRATTDKVDFVLEGVGAYYEPPQDTKESKKQQQQQHTAEESSEKEVDTSEDVDPLDGIDDRIRFWCCDDDAIRLGLCYNETNGYNRLIINHDLFQGEHRYLQIPASGNLTLSMQDYMIQFESGSYVMMWANCHPYGRPVVVRGDTKWRSALGYLPAQFYGFFGFVFLLTCLYVALYVWYMYGMCSYTTTCVERRISRAIGFGLLQMLFRTLDFLRWNFEGTRAELWSFAQLICGIMLETTVWIVLWTLTSGRLRWTRRRAAVAFTYFALALVQEVLMSCDEERRERCGSLAVYRFIRALAILLPIAQVLFGFYIVYLLNRAIRRMSHAASPEADKHMHYSMFRIVILMIAVVGGSAGLVNAVVDKSRNIGTDMNLSMLKSLLYWITLFVVALLWRVHAGSKDYTHVYLALPVPPPENGDGLRRERFLNEHDQDTSTTPDRGDALALIEAMPSTLTLSYAMNDDSIQEGKNYSNSSDDDYDDDDDSDDNDEYGDDDDDEYDEDDYENGYRPKSEFASHTLLR